jgi:hypothetical protein
MSIFLVYDLIIYFNVGNLEKSRISPKDGLFFALVTVSGLLFVFLSLVYDSVWYYFGLKFLKG